MTERKILNHYRIRELMTALRGKCSEYLTLGLTDRETELLVLEMQLLTTELREETK